jgi:hypothetical protein
VKIAAFLCFVAVSAGCRSQQREHESSDFPSAQWERDQWGRFFVHFFPGKIPRKIFPQKILGKIAIFRGKSFEKSFFNKFDGIFRGKSLSAEKNVRKIGPFNKQQLQRGGIRPRGLLL